MLVLLASFAGTFGLCASIVLGLSLGGAVAGLPGGLLAMVALTVAYVVLVRRGWRRVARAAGR